ncbi:MAG: helix-turn-helix domain-containing protein [Bifidobacteriaceae bacterium]|jgi:excisionase family DNA binding protein|nr:helix-turn-helix domain-containing protein [Bifidobacteriaceae bacterium]
MAEPLLTLDPDQVDGASPTATLPAWADDLLARVRAAAQAGETVTVTSDVRMLTPAQVGRRLGVSRSTVTRRIAKGEIHAVMVGNRHRIPYPEYQRIRRELAQRIAADSAEDVEAELFG